MGGAKGRWYKESWVNTGLEDGGRTEGCQREVALVLGSGCRDY